MKVILVQVLIFCSFFLSTHLFGAELDKNCETNLKIVGLVLDIQKETVENKGVQGAADLAYATASLSPAQIDAVQDRTIDLIASLLSDKRNDVKMYAAVALGQLGKRASRALPALKLALKNYKEVGEGDVILPSVSGKEEILDSIRQIEAKR